MSAVVLSGGKVLGGSSGIFNVGQGGGGATLIFSYPSGFAGSSGTIGFSATAGLSGSVIALPNNTGHRQGAAWYTTAQPPGPFTTTFTFTPTSMGATAIPSGITFCLQRTTSPPSEGGFAGIFYSGDANMCGYSAYTNQNIPPDSIAIKFDATAIFGQYFPAGTFPASTGLYLNGGPVVTPGGSLGLIPYNDLAPYGINFYSGDTFAVTIVYDGSLLTMTIQDTTTNAQARCSWPLNLANTTNANGNYVGFTVGQVADGIWEMQNWTYWSGYNTRLSTPTFSPTPGEYSGTQSVTISGSGTIYYTLNGLQPTAASTLYTGTPISVTANQVIQAVAIETNFTDSLVGVGAYQIGTANLINLPSGFSANDGVIPVGFAYKSGSSLVLTDNSADSQSGAAWFSSPVNIQSGFSTTFQVAFSGTANGMCFVLQNSPQPYAGLTGVQITGTSGEISFNATNVAVGQFVSIAGTFGGTGSISGYSNPTLYLIGVTNGTTTATLQAAGVTSASQSGTTFNTVAQALAAGTPVYIVGSPPGGFTTTTTYYVVSSGLTSTTCELSATSGGSAISCSSSSSCTIVPMQSGGGATLTTTAGTPAGLTFSVNASNMGGGPTALGFAQSGMGYGGIGNAPAQGMLNSVAIAFDLYSNPNTVNLVTNGTTPGGASGSTATGLTFNGGTFNVTLSYSGTTLSISMQKTTGGTTFTHNWTIDIPGTVDADTAYAGFTGGTGGETAIQEITEWTYAQAA